MRNVQVSLEYFQGKIDASNIKHEAAACLFPLIPGQKHLPVTCNFAAAFIAIGGCCDHEFCGVWSSVDRLILYKL